MSGMSLLAGKALSSARMSDILSQTSLTGSQQLQQRGEPGQQHDGVIFRLSRNTSITQMTFCLVVCDVEGELHAAATYPSSCTSDMLLTYKPPDLQYSMEQAGV